MSKCKPQLDSEKIREICVKTKPQSAVQSRKPESRNGNDTSEVQRSSQ